jgi:F-type H+-transporting ATPase subunit epsilon
MNLQIITPTGIRHQDTVRRIQFSSATGLMEILDNHAPMIAELKAGKLTTDTGEFDCGGGVVKVKDNEVKVICE